MSNNATCTHIKVTGLRCGSPALTGEQFCYFHQNAHRGVRRPKQSRLHPIALIEDEESIQYALMEVINALMRNTIDLKRATLILRALHIAVKNASRVKYNLGAKDMVTKIPQYTAPTEEHEALAMESDLPAVAANPNLAIGPEGPHYWEKQAETARRLAREESQRFAAEAKSREEARKRFAEERAAESKARAQFVNPPTVEKAPVETPSPGKVHVGTAAIGCPAPVLSEVEGQQASASVDATPTRVGKDAFVRPASPSAARVSASAPAAKATTTPVAIPPHDFKKPSQPTQSQTTASDRTEPKAPQRKPPTSATPAPKERKNAAHRASGG